MADRFFFEGPLQPGPVTLDGPEAHHLAHVRRFAVGDAVTLFNGDGAEYPAIIESIARKTVDLRVTSVERPDREPPHRLHIAASIPKGDRGDFLIEKLTELGVAELTPLHTERSIVKIDDGKLEKMRRAVIEASKQCGRNHLMAIHPPRTWGEWCKSVAGPRFVAHTAPNDCVLPKIAEEITVAVGPEGGFSEAEIATATAAGWVVFTLGSRILRMETAAIAIAAQRINF